MKLTITESQLETIINHIQESDKKVVLEEGWKEVVLGTAMLLGIGLTGVNAQIATNALDNEQILQQIEQTLESDKIERLVATLEKAGYRDGMKKLEANKTKLEDNFNKAAAKKGLNLDLKVMTATSDKDAMTAVSQGYSVTDVEITSDTILTTDTTVFVKDTLTIDYGSDAMFITAGYELTPQTIDDINTTVKSIIDMKGKIVKVYIESSTDKEPIQMGNEQLAQLRAEAVQKLLVSQGVEGDIAITTKADSGPDMYSRTMSREQRQQARTETAQYRYVTVKIVSIIPAQPTGDETTKDVVERVEYKLVKARIPTKGKKRTGKHRFSINIFKCGGLYKGGKTNACPKKF